LERKLIQKAAKLAEAKEQDFDAMFHDFRRLRSENERQVNMKKDAQETASVIFAIVATVFLPLVTVASILGMNTADIREMHQRQWVFWTTGVPIAVLTAVACIWTVDKTLLVKRFEWFHLQKSRITETSQVNSLHIIQKDTLKSNFV